MLDKKKGKREKGDVGEVYKNKRGLKRKNIEPIVGFIFQKIRSVAWLFSLLGLCGVVCVGVF